MTEFNQKIYKIDSKGKVRILHIFTDNGEVVQQSGILDGSLVEHRSVAHPKNEGKANATTAQEQAVKEAEAKIKLKLRKEYFTSVDEATDAAANEEVIMPMLAKVYEKETKKIKFPCCVQPKLDGMRCLAIFKNNSVRLYSRTNKEILTMAHIVKALMPHYQEGLILDGELYAHGLTFQENMKLLKKYRAEESEKINYHIYDTVSPAPFTERITRVFNLGLDDPLKFVVTHSVEDFSEIKMHNEYYVSIGYEGLMVRHSDEGYKISGRSSQLLKMKIFQDIALTIKDVIPNDANPDHGSFIFDWKGATGHPLGDDILGCGMKFSHAERQEILLNKNEYVGKTAELRFFEYSDKGVPRFPVAVGIRLDK